MKKATKITLYIALGLVVLGLALYAAAIGITGRFNFAPGTPDSTSTKEITQIITNPVHSIRITDVECSIQLLPAEDGNLTVTYTDTDNYRHTISVQDGTLIITAEETGNFWSRLFKFSTGDHTLTLFLPFEEFEKAELVTVSGSIQIPAQFTIRALSAGTISGDVDLSCQVLEELDVQTTSGNLILQQISPVKLDIETVSGEVTLSNVAVTEYAELSSVSGNIHLNDFDCPSLDAETVSGSVTGTVLSPKHIQAETTSGSVYISENRSDAPTWDIETVSGDIHLTISP